ncbi:nudix hydrolase 26, chloroplastic [Diospyros lotus]|uniref:nudix hydrolase 26, chloroplastic n=1 Tax=Diospyros lotus TaxID=55363 RepID=UPI00224D831E|nr:nudix hydrolase 26, chloroplastic [Diospyros lotus]
MALCRRIVFSKSPFPRLPSPTLSSPNCPLPSLKFTGRPLRISSRASQSAMEAAPPGYRRNVGVCLINPSKKIFTASRLDIPDAWQMPQGGIDEGEDPRGAVLRELREETGITSAEIIAEVPYWLTYDFPSEVGKKLKRQYGTDWKGQAQKWFLLKFTGKDEEINLAGDGTEKAEFGNWSWMSPEQVIDHAVDFKKHVYKEVMAAFSPYFQ